MSDLEAGSMVPGGSVPSEGRMPDLEWVDPEELAPPDDPLGDTLRGANARYALALATADAETLCDLFEPDGAIIDGAGPDVLGHEGLRDMAHYARERFDSVAFDIDVEWAKQDPLDPAVAHAAGTWSMAFVPRFGASAGETTRAHGRFAQRWHQGEDGAWRMHRDLTLTREDG